MKEIPLTQGFVALVDDADYEWLSHWNWQLSEKGGYLYAQRGAEKPPGIRTIVRMHREILGLSPGQLGDHRDGNGLNNQRSNLRVATRAGNNRNRFKAAHVLFKGVFFTGTSYRAQIGVNSRTKHLGSFPDAVTAAHVYDDAARELHGEFARLNFPREGEGVPA